MRILNCNGGSVAADIELGITPCETITLLSTCIVAVDTLGGVENRCYFLHEVDSYHNDLNVVTHTHNVNK